MSISAAGPAWDLFGNRGRSWLDWLPSRKPVLLDVRTGDLIVGMATRLTIESRRAATARLHIRDDDGGEVYSGSAPPVGFVTITPLGIAPMRVRLALASRRGQVVDFEWTMTATAIPPAFSRVRAPSRVRVGETIPVSWQATGAVTIDVEGCGFREQRSGHGEGAFVLLPEQAGVMVLKFTATDRYAASVKTRIVTVVEIAPRIAVNRRIFVGRPGGQASFSWVIAGAEKAWLEARGERLPVGLDAAVEVGIGLDAEEFRLVAKGRGGTATARLSVIPRLLTGLD
jgi:hypothetical protein